MSLTKADIADRLFNEVGLNKREAKEFVDAYFETIRLALENGENVKLQDLVTFSCAKKTNVLDGTRKRERRFQFPLAAW